MDKFRTGMKGAWLALAGVVLSGQAFTASAATMAASQTAALQSLNEPQVESAHPSLPIKGYNTLSGTKNLSLPPPGLPLPTGARVTDAVRRAGGQRLPGRSRLRAPAGP